LGWYKDQERPYSFLVVTVKEPGANTPERGRRRVRMENKIVTGLEKRACGSV
jgi:hypothetical protein